MNPPLCEDCHQVPAVRVFLALSGCEYDLCDDCFALADHDRDPRRTLCEWCNRVPGERVFEALCGSTSAICEGCFEWIDHDACYCEFPEGDPGDTSCKFCTGKTPYHQNFCRCPQPTTLGAQRIRCRTCLNGIWELPTPETSADNPPLTPENSACSTAPTATAPLPSSDPTSPRSSRGGV